MDISAIASYVQPKEFQILVNGILQLVKVQIQENQNFQSSTNIQDYDLLIEKVKSLNKELEVNDLQNIIHVIELIVKKAAIENWSVDALSEFLSGHNVPEDYLAVLLGLWSRESAKIHQKLIELSTYNYHLSKNILWRVDMNAMSKQSADVNEVIAHFELNLKSSATKAEDTVKFEMNREEVQNIIQQFQQIQSCYQQLTESTPSSN